MAKKKGGGGGVNKELRREFAVAIASGISGSPDFISRLIHHASESNVENAGDQLSVLVWELADILAADDPG